MVEEQGTNELEGVATRDLIIDYLSTHFGSGSAAEPPPPAHSQAMLIAFGIATAFVGFAVIFPVLGYATWHSYRARMK